MDTNNKIMKETVVDEKKIPGLYCLPLPTSENITCQWKYACQEINNWEHKGFKYMTMKGMIEQIGRQNTLVHSKENWVLTWEHSAE